MTEKRFTLVDIGFIRDNGTLIGMYEIVNCLNALHEENEQLKAELQKLRKTVNKQYVTWREWE